MSDVEEFKKKVNLIENTVFYEPHFPYQILKKSIKKYRNSVNKHMIDFAETSMDLDYIQKKKDIFERDRKKTLKIINNFNNKGHRYSLLRYNRKSLMNYDPLLTKFKNYKKNQNLRKNLQINKNANIKNNQKSILNQQQNLKKTNTKVSIYSMYHKNNLINKNENYFSEENLLNRKPNFNIFFYKDTMSNPTSTEQNSSIHLRSFSDQKSESNIFNTKSNKNIFFTKSKITNQIRVLDYDNRNIKNILNRQINQNKIFNENFNNKLRLYHWKYMMTNNEKDLRPETFFNKDGGDIIFNQNFNKRLDNMISNLQGIDMIKASNSNNHLSQDNIFRSLKLRQIKEKKSIKFVKDLLKKDKQLIDNILSE